MAREDRRDDHREDRHVGDRRIPPPTEVRNGTSTSWPFWLLPLAALAGLGWFLLSGDQWGRQVADAPGTVVGTDTERRPAGPSLVVGGVDVGRQITTAADGLGNLLQGIRDPSSATAALPRLRDAARELDRMATMSGQLSQEGRTALANAASGSLAKLNTALDKAAAIPGVAPLLQPTLDQMRGRIDAIAMAPLPGRSFYAAAPGDWVLLSSLLNREVQGTGGERLGTVNEVFIGPDGRVAGVIVGVGRDLGFGEKTVAIPFGTSQMQRKDDGLRLIIDATKESLRTAPSRAEALSPDGDAPILSRNEALRGGRVPARASARPSGACARMRWDSALGQGEHRRRHEHDTEASAVRGCACRFSCGRFKRRCWPLSRASGSPICRCSASISPRARSASSPSPTSSGSSSPSP
jgi:sporulation protein YlmC with PRC-barrel domain